MGRGDARQWALAHTVPVYFSTVMLADAIDVEKRKRVWMTPSYGAPCAIAAIVVAQRCRCVFYSHNTKVQWRRMSLAKPTHVTGRTAIATSQPPSMPTALRNSRFSPAPTTAQGLPSLKAWLRIHHLSHLALLSSPLPPACHHPSMLHLD
jgi:hypothetical protein